MAVGSSIAIESDITPRNLRTAAICLMGQSLGSYMLAFNALPLVMLPMIEEFHWTRTQFSYAMSAMLWIGTIALPVQGRLLDRWGVRPMLLGGTAVAGLLTLALCWTSHLWQLYLCFALMGVVGCTVMGFAKVIGATFTKSRGKAFAMIWALSTVILSVFPELTIALMTRRGWRGVFSGFGLLILVVVALLFFILEEPDGTRLPSASAEKGPPSTAFPLLQGRTAAQALKDRAFWILVGGALLTNIGVGWVQHQVAFLIGRGFTLQQVVNVMSLMMFFSPLLAMLGGWLADRVQSARIYAPFALLTALGILCQFLVSSSRGGTPLLFVAMYLGAITIYAQMPMAQYFCSRYFGMRAFGEIFSYYLCISGVVMGFSPPLIGLLFERTGSYKWALFLMIAGDLAAALLFLTLGPYRYLASPEADRKKAALA